MKVASLFPFLPVRRVMDVDLGLADSAPLAWWWRTTMYDFLHTLFQACFYFFVPALREKRYPEHVPAAVS
jgi:hypothetical protein